MACHACIIRFFFMLIFLQSRYNDLMTQSDKDFITRIQVSQLVTQDPYADDFYAQVYGAIMRSRLGLQPSDERVLKFGSSGGVGLGLGQKGAGRRPSAMQKMEQQVERIVNNARQREQDKREPFFSMSTVKLIVCTSYQSE
jgi:DNA topoisomerase 2-associated protein PAT1